MSRDYTDAVNETDLMVAQERLSRFSFVGIVEDFERSVRLLSHTLNLRLLKFRTEISPITHFKAWKALAKDPPLHCSNTSLPNDGFFPLICEVVTSLRIHGSTVAPSARSILAEENRFDVALHNFSRRVFEDRWSMMVRDLGGEPKPFKCKRDSSRETKGLCNNQAAVVSAIRRGKLGEAIHAQCTLLCSRDTWKPDLELESSFSNETAPGSTIRPGQ